MTPIELLLLSNSTGYGGTFLGHALDAVAETLGGRRHLLFVPYALADQGGYTARVRAALEPAGITVTGLDEATAPLAEVQRAEALFIGGGNSFRLLAELQRLDLVEAIRQRVLTGMPYLGASAGTNMACPSLRTSNDMPIGWSRSRSTRTTSIPTRPAGTWVRPGRRGSLSSSRRTTSRCSACAKAAGCASVAAPRRSAAWLADGCSLVTLSHEISRREPTYRCCSGFTRTSTRGRNPDCAGRTLSTPPMGYAHIHHLVGVT
jgi:hypothetical protein